MKTTKKGRKGGREGDKEGKEDIPDNSGRPEQAR